MKKVRGALAIVVGAAVVWPLVLAGQTRSVLDGVYTREQAVRGQKDYDIFCASCHAADLGGTNSGDSGAPPLRGETFMAGSDANALFTLIRTNMPREAPAGLSDRQYLDVMAYLFQQNGFPAGSDELTVNVERLRSIKIVGGRALENTK
ncbi:MAG: c-type cytochrome [Vicinamibacterales bacterium]